MNEGSNTPFEHRPFEYAIGHDTGQRLRRLATEPEELDAIRRLEEFSGSKRDVEAAALIFELAGRVSEAEFLLEMIVESRHG